MRNSPLCLPSIKLLWEGNLVSTSTGWPREVYWQYAPLWSWVRSIFTPLQFSALGSLQNVYKTTSFISPVLDCAWSFSMLFQPTMLIFETDWLIFSDRQRRGFVFCFWGLSPPDPPPQQISGITQINSVIPYSRFGGFCHVAFEPAVTWSGEFTSRCGDGTRFCCMTELTAISCS